MELFNPLDPQTWNVPDGDKTLIAQIGRGRVSFKGFEELISANMFRLDGKFVPWGKLPYEQKLYHLKGLAAYELGERDYKSGLPSAASKIEVPYLREWYNIGMTQTISRYRCPLLSVHFLSSLL